MDTLTADATPHPIPLALGDFDKDGYPDVLLLTVPPGQPSDGSGKTSVHILRNIRCGSVSNGTTRDLCRKGSSLSGADSDDQGRWLTVNDVATEVLDGIDDARSASWVDIDEDGSLDIVLQRGHRSDGGKRTITFVQNNYFYDAFFLKVLTLNGACGSICEEQVQDHVTKYKPWGASLPGASYKFTVLDPNGNRRAQQVGQQYASTYRSLLTPYSYFGLGRTNNYVETLFVGSTLHDEGSYLISMEGVIPNSQVVISPGKDGQQWHRELYLQPGDWIPWVTVVLVTLIVALCGFVFAMHVNERVSFVFMCKAGGGHDPLTTVCNCAHRERMRWNASVPSMQSTLMHWDEAWSWIVSFSACASSVDIPLLSSRACCSVRARRSSVGWLVRPSAAYRCCRCCCCCVSSSRSQHRHEHIIPPSKTQTTSNTTASIGGHCSAHHLRMFTYVDDKQTRRDVPLVYPPVHAIPQQDPTLSKCSNFPGPPRPALFRFANPHPSRTGNGQQRQSPTHHKGRL